MANVLQLKRGTTARRLTYTPAPGEPVVDLTQNKLYYGNGTTVGGVPVEAEDSSKVSKVLPLSTAQAYRDVASFYNSAGAVYGAIVIHLPASKNAASTMMQIKIKGYNYLTSTGAFELLCGFFQQGTSNIGQFSAALLGSFPSDQVRYARAADHSVIILGDVNTLWTFPNIHIPEVVCSYAGYTGWEEGWSITLETDLSAYTVKATPTVYGGPRAKTADVLTTARTIGGVSFDGSANINLPGVNTAGYQSTTGNAATATRLATARTFTYTGDVTGSVSFDGSANVSAAMTLANSGVAAGTYKSVTVDVKGRVTAGADVVTGLVTSTSATGTTNAATTNTNTFLNIVEKVGTANASPGTSTQVTGAGTVTVTSDTAGKLTITGAQSITGNAATATKLATARTINGVAFDGTSNITIGEGNSLFLGAVQWFNGNRASIPDGWLAADGQVVSRETFPALWAMVGTVFPAVSDIAWLASTDNRGSYSNGDGVFTFRLPDLNGAQTNSLRGLFVRGDGNGNIAGQNVTVGTTLSDSIRNISGSLGVIRTQTTTPPLTGPFYQDSSVAGSIAAAAGTSFRGVGFDASLTVPTSDENRPVSAVGVWIIRAAGSSSPVPASGSAASLLANTFNGSQKIVGNLEVTGNLDISGTLAFAKGFENSLNETGWQKLPGGLILQWGYTVKTASTTVPVVFPIVFPQSCLGVYTQLRSTSQNCQSTTVNLLSPNGFTLYWDNGATGFYWFAIGK